MFGRVELQSQKRDPIPEGDNLDGSSLAICESILRVEVVARVGIRVDRNDLPKVVTSLTSSPIAIYLETCQPTFGAVGHPGGSSEESMGDAWQAIGRSGNLHEAETSHGFDESMLCFDLLCHTTKTQSRPVSNLMIQCHHHCTATLLCAPSRLTWLPSRKS
jgi:hypothetical protein